MKSINSSARTISLIGLSIFVHGAAFWAFSENISLKEVAQIIEETHRQANRSEIAEKIAFNHEQAVKESVAQPTSEKVQETQNLESQKTEAKKEEKPFEFKKVESFSANTEKKVAEVKKKQAPKKPEVATVLPEKVQVSETENSLPKNTVTVDDSKTEAQAKIDKTPKELLEVENTDLLSELRKSESVAENSVQSSETQASGQNWQSYLGFRQASGNRPPQYPLAARREGQQGRVLLKYFINEKGAVENIKVAESSGHKILDDEALRAVSSYRYYPGQSGWAEHPVKFSLNGLSDSIPAELGASN